MMTTYISNIDLTTEERTVVNAAHEAMVALKRTFEHWTMIGRGLMALRNKADRMGGRKTFDRLREQAGLGPEHLDKAIVSRLFRVMEELPAVETWRQTLTGKQQFDWASPGAVVKHCPVFNKPKARDREAAPIETPMSRLKVQVRELTHEREHLQERLNAAQEGDRWKPTDTAAHIAVVMVGLLTHNKVKELIAELKKRLPASVPSTPKPKVPSKARVASLEKALNAMIPKSARG